jgi:hypothetical protein
MIAPTALSLIAVIGQVSGTEAPRSNADEVAAAVQYASNKFDVPQAWIWAVLEVESAGNPKAVSPKGASGLMQLMPQTWEDLRVRYGLGADVHNVRDNVLAGTAYLKDMCIRYGAPGFLAAYNAGPGRYELSLKTGQPLPTETVLYIRKIQQKLGADLHRGASVCAKPQVPPWRSAALFASTDNAPSPTPSSLFPSEASPFVAAAPVVSRRAEDVEPQGVPGQ